MPCVLFEMMGFNEKSNLEITINKGAGFAPGLHRGPEAKPNITGGSECSSTTSVPKQQPKFDTIRTSPRLNRIRIQSDPSLMPRHDRTGTFLSEVILPLPIRIYLLQSQKTLALASEYTKPRLKVCQ